MESRLSRMSSPPVAPGGNSLTRNFPALAYRDYTMLFVATVFSAGAHWALLLARAWLVYELSESSTAVGLVTFAGMAPFLFAAPIAGALADRLDRRSLSLWASYISLAGTLALAFVTLADLVAVWQVVVLAFVGGIARAVQMPAAQAMIPNIVPREHLLNGIALQSISNHGSRLIGPLVGGVLLATLGAGFVFLLSSGLFVLSCITLWQIRYRFVPEGGAQATTVTGVWRDMVAGIEYVSSDRRISLIIALVVFHCALTMAFEALLPQLSAQVSGVDRGDRTFSAMMMGIGAGAVIGTVIISKLGTPVAEGRALAITGVGSTLAMLVLGLGMTPWMLVIGAMLAGGTQASYMALSAAFAQQVTEDRMRGRVMSIYAMLAAGHMAVLNLGFGTFADFIGVRPLLIGPPLVWLVIFIVTAIWLVDLRHLLRTGTFFSRPQRIAVAEAAGGGG
jgi:MFS family permease